MSELKAIDHIEKVQPEGLEECGLPKAPYYVIHYEDGQLKEAECQEVHDEPSMTKNEVLQDLDEAFKLAKLAKTGKVCGRPARELLSEL